MDRLIPVIIFVLLPFLMVLGQVPEIRNDIKDFVFHLPKTPSENLDTPNGVFNNTGTLVVGGIETGKNEFPWIVNLLIYSTQGVGLCGGNIINETWILTAAHCVWPLNSINRIVATAGDHYRNRNDDTEQTREVATMYVPSTFNERFLSNDIALLELRSSFQLNNNVRVVHLADPTFSTGAGSPAVVVGWGSQLSSTSPTDELRKATLNIVSNAACTTAYQNVEVAIIQSSMVCASASGRGTCNGDSGGHLYCSTPTEDLFVCGTTSFGVEGQCGNSRWRNAFQRTSSHVAWIRNFVTVHTSGWTAATTTTTTRRPAAGTGCLALPSFPVSVIVLIALIWEFLSIF